jgi:hypothetical protein
VVGKKELPLRVSVNEMPLATMDVGVMDVSTGNGFAAGLMMRGKGAERPLFPAPEEGFTVIMVATPGCVTSDAGTTAVMELLVKAPVLSVGTVVTRLLPFH